MEILQTYSQKVNKMNIGAKTFKIKKEKSQIN